jgi:hypothetical protein
VYVHARIPPTLDGRFPNSNGFAEKRQQRGFHALDDCASHDGCRKNEMTWRDRANKKNGKRDRFAVSSGSGCVPRAAGDVTHDVTSVDAE